MSEDASERIFALLGDAVHSILERAADDRSLVEVRHAVSVPAPAGVARREPLTVSGKFDHLALDGEGNLQDYKTMSVWEYVRGVREEREQQLNLLALILNTNGVEIRTIEAVCIFRDWSPGERDRSGRDYPRQQVERVKLELWPELEQREFLDERIRLHEAAKIELPLCSIEERWGRPDTFAIMKEGGKRAVRVLDTQDAAERWASEHGAGVYTARLPDELDANPEYALEWSKPHYLEVRKGDSLRCRYYCAVSEFCNQWQVQKEGDENG